MSAMIVNQDHYINQVVHGGGTYTLEMAKFDTPYVVVFLRVLVNASDETDVAAVNAIQDQMVIKAVSSKPFTVPDYDEDGFKALVTAILGLGRLYRPRQQILEGKWTFPKAVRAD